MSKFIPGSTSNVYRDIDGNDCSLFHLVNESPEWACSRIREGEKAAAELAALRELFSRWAKSGNPVSASFAAQARLALQEKGE